MHALTLSQRCATPDGQRGFTLVELILVIALAGIVATMLGAVLSRPLEGFVAQSRRAKLVDNGALVLARLRRDIGGAVPGSLRISADKQALELLPMHSAGRYLPNRSDGVTLSFDDVPDATCNSVDGLPRCDVLQVLDPDFQPPASGWLVVGAESDESIAIEGRFLSPWKANSGAITPTGTGFTRLADSADGITRIKVSGDFAFAEASPRRRFYFADRVVGYRCLGGQLLRYEYATLLPVIPATPPTTPQLLADRIENCHFEGPNDLGVATLRLGLGAAGESIRLVQQIQVNNAP